MFLSLHCSQLCKPLPSVCQHMLLSLQGCQLCWLQRTSMLILVLLLPGCHTTRTYIAWLVTKVV